MAELQARWAQATSKLDGTDAQGRAEFLRDALLTHLELVKRGTLEKKVGEAVLQVLITCIICGLTILSLS